MYFSLNARLLIVCTQGIGFAEDLMLGSQEVVDNNAIIIVCRRHEGPRRSCGVKAIRDQCGLEGGSKNDHGYSASGNQRKEEGEELVTMEGRKRFYGSASGRPEAASPKQQLNAWVRVRRERLTRLHEGQPPFLRCKLLLMSLSF